MRISEVVIGAQYVRRDREVVEALRVGKQHEWDTQRRVLARVVGSIDLRDDVISDSPLSGNEYWFSAAGLTTIEETLATRKAQSERLDRERRANREHEELASAVAQRLAAWQEATGLVDEDGQPVISIDEYDLRLTADLATLDRALMRRTPTSTPSEATAKEVSTDGDA